MFKLFKKKKSKKDKESKKDQNKENIENKEKIIDNIKPTETETNEERKLKKQDDSTNQLSVDTATQTNGNGNANANVNSSQPSPSVLLDSQNESTFQHTSNHDNLHDQSHLTDQHHHSMKTNELNATFSGADLNRILTSGYLTGDEDMGYLKHGVELKTPKSPHFHRPPNFSYSHQPSVLLTHSHKKTNQGLLTSTLSSISTVKKIRHYSTSPTRSIESEEAIRLSRLPGGYVPDPEVPKKIESLDWPSPPYPAAVPELRSRSRSTSNKRQNVSLSDDANKDQVDSVGHNTTDNNVKTSAKVYRKIFDNQHDDYMLRFKRNKNEDNEEDENEGEIVDEKLKRDLEEISKLENKSGIAKIIAKDLKAHEKLVHKQLDPWKASRTPNANIEPHQKTRFESPVNASPSRVICPCKNANLSHHICEDGLCSSSAISSSTIHKDGITPTTTTLLCSTPRKGNTLQKTPVTTTKIVYNIPVPKPGYGLSSPRATTLPNSSRYTGISTHKSVDFDSLGIGNYSSGQNDLNTSTNNDKIKLNSANAYIHSRNAHATRSTPNLIGTPKIYKYEELRIGYKKKLPPDVDRERLERHLAPDELTELFGVATLEEFYELPEWKRVELKKKAKLF